MRFCAAVISACALESCFCAASSTLRLRTAVLCRLQILRQLCLPLRALGKTLFHGGQVRAAGGELLALPALQIAQGEIALCHAVGESASLRPSSSASFCFSASAAV